MSADAETLAVYARRAEDYVNLVTGDGPDLALQSFLTGLPDRATVLDLGCGPGHTAARMRDLGYHVTAMDASSVMARIARDTYGLDVITAGFDDLADIDAFDGVWASFSLLHAPKARMPCASGRDQPRLAPRRGAVAGPEDRQRRGARHVWAGSMPIIPMPRSPGCWRRRVSP